MMTNQQLLEVRHPEPLDNLVERVPVQDGKKLSKSRTVFEKNHERSWTDLRGLGWLVCEDWS